MQMRLYPDPKHLKLREFFVDLLGSLVPGFIFTFLAVVSLGWPLCGLCSDMIQSPLERGEQTDRYDQVSVRRDVGRSGEVIEDRLKTFRFEVIFFGITLSYVVGHFFFRRTPKIPDILSVWRTKKELVDDVPAVLLNIDNKRSVLSRIREGIELFFGKVPRIVKKLEKDGKIDVQFPYLYLWEYLNYRGLDHLGEMIPWQGEKPETHSRRTKAFINILKIRLEFDFPEKCGNITRNEAHIRLMSSMWYMSCYLQRIGILSFVLILGILVVTGMFYRPWAEVCLICWSPLICSAFIIVGTWFMRLIIEKFFHYQRVREIVYVLETAHYSGKYGVFVPEKGEKVPFTEIIEDLGRKT